MEVSPAKFPRPLMNPPNPEAERPIGPEPHGPEPQGAGAPFTPGAVAPIPPGGGCPLPAGACGAPAPGAVAPVVPWIHPPGPMKLVANGMAVTMPQEDMLEGL